MKKGVKIVLALLLIFLFPHILLAGQFKVTRVYDGDTLGVGGRGIELKVRLAAIDAPDISKNKINTDQPYSRQAKRYLSDLVLHKIIVVDRCGLDHNNRMLAVVYVGTKNINLEMVKAGLARVSRAKLPKSIDMEPYLQAEKESRQAGKGMWSHGNRYVGPKYRRKTNK
jgi:endonuclease YncB( thermonuclease family)